MQVDSADQEQRSDATATDKEAVRHRRDGMPGIERDVWLCVVLFFVAFGVCLVFCQYWLPNLTEVHMRRVAIEPAVMVALGKGYSNPILEEVPAIDDFVARRCTVLDTSSLPMEIPTRELTRYQREWYYLLYTMGLYWRVFGVSWDNLSALYALFYAVAAVAVYGVFRIGLGRGAAVLGALLLVLSPVQLTESSGIRDYSKAPFMLAVFALLGLAVKKKLSRRAMIALAAVLGLIIALGACCRTDVLVCLPGALVVFLLFIQGPFRQTWLTRLLAGGALIVSWGVFSAGLTGLRPARVDAGSYTWHVVDMGLTTGFEKKLGVGGVPYDIGQEYNDAFTHAAIGAYGKRVQKRPTRFLAPSPEYESASRSFCLRHVRTFPADHLLRVYAAVLRILDEGPFIQTGWRKAMVSQAPEAVRTLHRWRWAVFGFLYGHGKYLAAVVLLMLAARSLRYALAGLFFIMYFCGNTCLQFDIRHCFHMEFVPWWCLLFVAERVVSVLRPARLEALRRAAANWVAPAKRMAGFACVSVAALAAPLYGLRAYQYFSVEHLYEKYRESDLVRLETDEDTSCDRFPRATVFRPEGLFTEGPFTPPEDRWEAYADYIAVELAGQGEEIEVYFAYNKDAYLFHPYRRWVLRAGDEHGVGSTWLLAPLYNVREGERWHARFEGVVVSDSDAHHVKGIYRLADPGSVPFFLTLTLTPDWENLPRYHTLQKRPKPYVARRIEARRNNLIANGGFERWTGRNEAPDGFDAPQRRSRLFRETQKVSEGRTSVRQVWEASDGRSSIFDMFHVRLSDLAPNTTYELILEADNLTGCLIRVSAWQVSPAKGKAESVQRLDYPVIDIVPRYGFKEYAGQFTTKVGEDFAVVLCASCRETDFPATALWDNWRLVKVTP